MGWYILRVHDFERLDVYQAAMALAVEVFGFVKTLPKSQRFEVASQLHRSSVSVPSNIAEGAGRGDRSDFARFIRIAIGSVCELQCQLDICRRLAIGDGDAAETLHTDASALRRRLYRLEQSLKKPAG